MFGGLIDAVRYLRPSHSLRRIKHAELESRLHQALYGRGDFGFTRQSLFDCGNQGFIGLTTIQIEPVLDAQRGCGFSGGNKLVLVEDIVDGIAIGHHVTIKAPFLAQNVLQQARAGRCRFAIDAVVSAHNRLHMRITHQRMKCGQIGLVQITLAGMHIKVMPTGFRPAMHRVVLGGGDHFEILGIITLHGFDELDAHAAGQIGIFAIGFLTTAPTWIAEDVDIWRPESQSLIALAQAAVEKLVMLGTRLITDCSGNIVHQCRIKTGRQTNGLGEHGGGASTRHAVQGLIPPFVSRNIQTWYGFGTVGQLQNFFFQRHVRHQIGGAFIEAAIQIVIDRCIGQRCCRQQQRQRGNGQ